MSKKVIVVHELSTPDCQLKSWLVEARERWGKEAVHLDAFALPDEEWEKVQMVHCIHKVGTSDRSSEVLSTADTLYAESYPGEPYYNIIKVLQAALALERN